mgnify:CR=1 FL=1
MVEYKRFFDALEYGREHNMTIAEAFRCIGVETDPVRMCRYWLSLEPTHTASSANDHITLLQNTAEAICVHARQAALLTLRQATFPENMEGNQFSLANLWVEMITRHYTELAESAAFHRVPIDHEQTARLYRQVCFFYDDLWYYNLHQRILDTGQVSRHRMSDFIEGFRQATRVACTIHENVPITPGDMSIFGNPEEVQEDYDFYVHGKLSKPYYEADYTRVFCSLDVKKDGTTRESTARLHFRTCQVLDLSHRMSSMEMTWWWRLQFELVHENLGTIITKVVPIPQ